MKHPSTSSWYINRASAASIEPGGPRAATFALLLDLEAGTGGRRFGIAARSLEAVTAGTAGGRPPIDDTAALAEVWRMMQQGKSRALAVLTVARNAHKDAAAVQRMRKRLLTKTPETGFRPDEIE